MNHQGILSPKEIQQIAYQLEQLCRNVEPVFRVKKREETLDGRAKKTIC